MTERVYDRDPERLRCRAKVSALRTEADAAWVELDRTVFYPEGGGQPADHGCLTVRSHICDVVDVQIHHGRIWHRVASPVAALEVGRTVRCHVDLPRRRDHTQQHSAQHLLSRVTLDQLGAPTLAFHLGAADSTIDVAMPAGRNELEWERWSAVELAVNRSASLGGTRRITRQSRLDAAAAGFKIDGVADGEEIRLVSLGRLDTQPCCGTHVRSLAECLPIKITSVERARERKVRVHFVAGMRAMVDYHDKMHATQVLSSMFSVPPEGLLDAVRRHQEERDQLLKSLKRSRKALMLLEAEALSQQAVAAGVVTAVFDAYTRDDMAQLAAQLKELPGGVYLVSSRSTAYHWYAVAPGDRRQIHVGDVLREVLTRFGGRGHGQPDFAQGGGVAEGDIASFRKAFERHVGEAAGWAQLPP